MSYAFAYCVHAIYPISLSNCCSYGRMGDKPSKEAVVNATEVNSDGVGSKDVGIQVDDVQMQAKAIIVFERKRKLCKRMPECRTKAFKWTL